MTLRPFGLVQAVVGAAPDSAFSLIWTDVEGGERKTLVGPGTGPGSLQGLSFRPGRTFVARSGPGVWVWSDAASDTVFEVVPGGKGRRLAIGASGGTLSGMYGDPGVEILWLLRSDGRSIYYEGYAVAGEGTLSAASRLLGIRTTPTAFTPHDVVRGTAVGWTRTEDRANPFVVAAYDLRVGELGPGARR